MNIKNKSRALLGLALLAAGLAGCQTNQQFIAANQDAALKVVTTRAAFEMNCQAVTPTVLSSKVAQMQYGYARTEYTVGVRGCGKQAVYMALCLDTSTCNAYTDTARLGQY
ncbi:hypothetical protein [Pseudomonas arsenicoxydans]|uniref:Lipoprotein n=1 Tax=Pseudomonas arsenicoxydans TaxID=702115 RepID=A0A502HNZ7_9PSED|nr:hypothetical protein [Pseudomonas arsenicoxydans]TPG75463.1 hypothetical protein EAH78_21675 [Pseudomonas arsenicoxydans]